MTPDDENRVIAAADLTGRTGATSFELGCLHEDVPVAEAGWYATAYYKGMRIIAENHSDPCEAAEALAVKLLTGAKCMCGKIVTLDGISAFAFINPVMADGSSFSVDDAVKAGQCHWKRTGKRWNSACGR